METTLDGIHSRSDATDEQRSLYLKTSNRNYQQREKKLKKINRASVT